MSGILGIDTAIGWAHWQVRGGWKNVLLTTGAYMGIVIVVIVLTVRVDPRNTGMMQGLWLQVLLLLEAAMLILLGGTRVAAAVRSDITSRMIESHRLMPISNWSAIMGYLWGPTAQSVFMAGATFLIGLVVAMQSGISAGAWIQPAIIVAMFSAFFWVIMAFLASVMRAPAMLISAIVFVLVVSEGTAVKPVPAITVLLTPFMAKSAFVLRGGPITFDGAQMVGTVVQIWLAVALYIGAARKYRRSEDSALAIWPGIMLLIGWVAAGMIAMHDWDLYIPAFVYRRYGGLNFEFAIMGSLITAALLALVPVSNAAEHRDRGGRMIGVSLLAAAIIMPLGSAMGDWPGNLRLAMGVTFLSLAMLFIGSGYLVKIAGRLSLRAIIPLIAWLVLIGVLPLMVDHLIWSFSETEAYFSMSWISGLSPGALMAIVWMDVKTEIAPGVVAQVAYAVGWATLYLLMKRRAANPVPNSLPNQ